MKIVVRRKSVNFNIEFINLRNELGLLNDNIPTPILLLIEYSCPSIPLSPICTVFILTVRPTTLCFGFGFGLDINSCNLTDASCRGFCAIGTFCVTILRCAKIGLDPLPGVI